MHIKIVLLYSWGTLERQIEKSAVKIGSVEGKMGQSAKTLAPTLPTMQFNSVNLSKGKQKRHYCAWKILLLFHHPLSPSKVEEIKKMKIGDPLDRSTDHGPQNHKAHMEKLLEYCEVGIKEGATLVYGGKQVDRPGRTHTEHPDNGYFSQIYITAYFPH